jgi:hypothetical protein
MVRFLRVQLDWVLSASMAIWLTLQTQGISNGWVTAFICLCAFGGGTAFYFYMPLASMTNPPMNWGYPRNLGRIHSRIYAGTVREDRAGHQFETDLDVHKRLAKRNSISPICSSALFPSFSGKGFTKGSARGL